MLSKQPCTSIVYTHRSTNVGESFLIGQLDPAIDSVKQIKEFGTIIGCAVYFKKSLSSEEQIVATSLSANHGEIIDYQSVHADHQLELIDDENTCYGFITNKGYFLNRELALVAYRQFCKCNNMKEPLADSTKLYSYSVSWNAIRYSLVS